MKLWNSKKQITLLVSAIKIIGEAEDIFKNEHHLFEQYKNIRNYNSSDMQIECVEYIGDDVIIITREIEIDHYSKIKNIYFRAYNLNSNHGTLYYICELWGKPRFNSNLDFLEYFYIQDIGVKLGYRGQGYGSLVMTCFINYAKKLNLKKITGTLSDVDEQSEKIINVVTISIINLDILSKVIR